VAVAAGPAAGGDQEQHDGQDHDHREQNPEIDPDRDAGPGSFLLRAGRLLEQRRLRRSAGLSLIVGHPEAYPRPRIANAGLGIVGA
jgi:hypothetical protein